MKILDVLHYFEILPHSVSTNLPPTAYIKMVDGWLIFSLLKPFVDILVQTYIHTLRENYQETPVNKAQAWTKKEITWKIDYCQTFVRVVYPVFFLAFILIFWLIGLIYYIQ